MVLQAVSVERFSVSHMRFFCTASLGLHIYWSLFLGKTITKLTLFLFHADIKSGLSEVEIQAALPGISKYRGPRVSVLFLAGFWVPPSIGGNTPDNPRLEGRIVETIQIVDIRFFQFVRLSACHAPFTHPPPPAYKRHKSYKLDSVTSF